MPEEKKKKKKDKKKEEAPPPEPEPEPEPAPKKGPFDDEQVEWGAEEEPAFEAPPAEGEEAPPVEGEAPAEGEAPVDGEAPPPAEGEAPPAEMEEPIYQKKIQIGAHWRKPYMHLYSYNWDVEEFYYKPLVDSLNDKKSIKEYGPAYFLARCNPGRLPVSTFTGAQTYAERCVKYWPGQSRKDQLLYELEQEKNLKIMKKTKEEKQLQVQEQRFDEPPRFKDPLDQRVHPLTVAAKTSSLSTHLSTAAVHKRTSYLTDQVMDIFGLHVPESTAHDADLALFLRRLRKPVADIKQIEVDLNRHKRIKEQILNEDKATATSPVRRPNSEHSPLKTRPTSLAATGSEYNVERSGHIEQTARFLQRRKYAWKY